MHGQTIAFCLILLHPLCKKFNVTCTLYLF